METRDVHVALGEENVPRLGFLREIEREEVVALGEDERLRAVHILRLPVAEDAAGKADDVAAHVDHGEHEAVAERVVNAALLAVAHEPRVEELLLGVAEGLHGAG